MRFTSSASHHSCNAFPNALICGHTHKRVIGEVVPRFHCVNVGSDYGMLMHYLLEA